MKNNQHKAEFQKLLNDMLPQTDREMLWQFFENSIFSTQAIVVYMPCVSSLISYK